MLPIDNGFWLFYDDCYHFFFAIWFANQQMKHIESKMYFENEIHSFG